MKIKAVRTFVAAAALAGLAGVAQAQTYSFGDLLSGSSGVPTTGSFATLTAQVVGSDVLFTLDAFGLEIFGAGSFIRTIAVTGSNAGTTVGNVSGGVTSVNFGSGGGGFGDFTITLGQGNNNRLTDGETATWTWFGGAGKYTGFVPHVQGIGANGAGSGWYAAVTPVPEPATMALMLAGLGVVGAAAKRRAARQTETA